MNFKTYGKHVRTIFAKSITWALLFSFVISFIGVMLTVGGPGQTGIGILTLEKVFYGDEVGQSILNGEDTLESRIASNELTDEFRGQLYFFLFKALFSLIFTTIFLYAIFVLAESVQWNAFRKKNPFKQPITLKGFWLTARLNLVLILITLGVALVTFILYLGLQYFRIVVLLTGFIAFIGFMLITLVSIFLVHMIFMTNCIAVEKKSIKLVFNSFFTFSWKRLYRYLIPIYLVVLVGLVLLSKLGVWVFVKIPSAYGLVVVISVVLPLAWLRQLLYNYWKLQKTKN